MATHGQKISAGKAFTAHLRKMAGEAHTMDPEGNPINRGEALAELIWRQALGWTEVVKDAEGKVNRIVHPPVAWAQQFLFERTEGRAPSALPDEGQGVRAADRVAELAKDRLNSMAFVSVGKAPPSKPPKFKPKGL